jgi:hypothetical protein
MSKSIIGFHYALGGNRQGIVQFMEKLNQAGIPFMVKGAGDAGMCYEGQMSGIAHGVDNHLIYRVSGQNDGFDYDVPDYTKSPQEAASIHFTATQARWPEELDPYIVWMEPINEPRAKKSPEDQQYNDMHATDWLGWFMLEYAKIANAQGYKVCGPSFNSGEPEVFDTNDYAQPGMVAWLRYCSENPTKAALSVHEYVWDRWKTESWDDWYPSLWGRVEAAFAAADAHQIPRTFSVFMTEWGFARHEAPRWEQAERHLTAYNEWAAKWPQVKGVATWAFQMGWGTVDSDIQSWLAPLANYAVAREFDPGSQPARTHTELFGGGTLPDDAPTPPPPPPPPPDGRRLGDARIPYARTYYRVSGGASLAQFLEVAKLAYNTKSTVGFSNDDAGIGVGLSHKKVVEVGGQFDPQLIADWYGRHYGVADIDHIPYPETAVSPPPPPPQPEPGGGPFAYNGRSVAFTPAIHSPGSDWMWNDGELRSMLDYLALPIKFMSIGSNRDYFGQYGANRWHLVRVFYQPDGSRKSGEQVWGEVGNDVIEFVRRGARNFELFNEPNLAQEGYGTMWANGQEFGVFLRDFAWRFRQACVNKELPQPLLYYPGLSPQFGGQYAFTDAALPACVDEMDGLCCHAYTGETADVGTAVNQIWAEAIGFQERYGRRLPVIVSECSVNRGGGAGIYQFKADVYRALEARARSRAGLEAIVYYISHWSPPAEQADHMESWLGTPLPGYYK